ncbi:MAG: two-component system, LytTR family, response regulator [Petroclostridium sp.]|jgi:two-component system LytT family response regulator|uniref:LytR/AlgR family response regulator transcription factor n=1 Tax=Petroclostridium xylanilyticum TaxID=1792311 RepID=UPI000B98B780|nr:LytTR family DNA-binding domain-containing protein [Petroclostridium xylanilyticum]MBZ4646453.1 two component transcriptional regulator, LytTR family [Clostridia bacterium]MDK2810953.1 two-component system, LytTR family, response regulator [Petroclostridium sp.]
MINILIVEDEQIARTNLARMLQSLSEEIKILEASTGKEAIQLLKQTHINLFFLDIQLPDISGLKVAETIRSIPKYELTYIVFVTAHVQYQLEAFKKYHCYDYIEKPYTKEDVLKVAERLIRGVQSIPPAEKAICFELRDFILKIRTDDILFIESRGRNCVIHTSSRLYTIPNIAMKKMLDKLADETFIQTHKSYIVNIKSVERIDKVDRSSWRAYFQDYSLTAYISDKYKESFMKRLSNKIV